MAALLTLLLRMSRGYRGRVLFLRRFGTDKPPNYRLSRLISALCYHGYEVVTLADHDIDRDFTSVRALSGPISLIINIIVISSVIFVETSLLVFILIQLRLPLLDNVIMFSLFWIFGALIILLPLIPDSKFGYAYILSFWIQRWTAHFLTSMFPTNVTDFSSAELSKIQILSGLKLKKRWQIGFNIVIASDQNWDSVVHIFVNKSDVVIIDLTHISNNILQEISILSKNKTSNSIIWMYANGIPPNVSLYTHGYFVHGIYFPGIFNEFVYPAQHSREYNSDEARYSTIDPIYVDLSRRLIGDVNSAVKQRTMSTG